MPRVTNLQAGRQKAVQVFGLKELQQRMNEQKNRITGPLVNALMIDAGRILFDQAAANLASTNAPHEVRNDLFIFGKNKSSLVAAEKSVTCLVGLRKHGQKIKSAGYVEWWSNRQTGQYEKTSRTRKRKQSLRMVGTRIGENLGTMWELGTTKMPARPWWRPAILQSRNRMYELMADGLRKIVAM